MPKSLKNSNNESILIVAAEDSSVLYAERLLELWKNESRDIDTFGIGSKAMAKRGFNRIGCSEDLAVVGFMEVIGHWNVIKKVFDNLLETVRIKKPKVALLLDYPGFNLRLAKELKKIGIPVVYYISPQVWAWKKGRIKTIKNCVDKVLTIFPFETEFYKKYDVPVEFVGHPLLDEVESETLFSPDIKVLREKFGFSDEDIVLGLMPGSRKSEIKYNLKTQLETARKLKNNNTNLKVALLVAPGMEEEWLKLQLDELRVPLMIVKDSPFIMIQLVDVMLCASGTATVMVGLMKKPMVIMYKMNSITAVMAKMLVRSTPFFGMVNLIMEKEIVPERFQEKANVDELSRLLQIWISDKAKLIKKSEELTELKGLLKSSDVRKGEKDLRTTEKVSANLDQYFLQASNSKDKL